MKYIILSACSLLLLISSCSKSPSPAQTRVRTNTFTVNWFRDSTTPNPTAFIDLYNGKAYTMSQAVTKADSVDLFCYDHSALTVSGQDISLINMAFFGAGTYDPQAVQLFQDVVGVLPLSNYNTSTIDVVSITPADYTNITYNADISSIFSTKALNGGQTDISIAASDLNTTKYYQFKCSKNGKRGFLHVISANYSPGGTMTIEEKVEE